MRIDVSRRLLTSLILLCIFTSEGRADWLRTSELAFNTAFTVDRGELEIGVFSPLRYGVSETVQFSTHPILILVGAVNLSLRWRVTPVQKVTVALNVSADVDLVNQENLAGDRGTGGCSDCGVPSRFQTTATISFELSKNLLLSLGVGPSVDLVDVGYARFMAELHGSLIWMIDTKQLLLLHGSGYVNFDGPGETKVPSAQLMYSRACGNLNLGLGLAFGSFEVARNATEIHDWFAYPVMDLWWRF
jgi:hypothetical protein